MTEQLFKTKKKTINFLGNKYKHTEYQCPICKKWFISYLGNCGGVLMHITKIAKSEAIAKQLKEIKQIPHFVFWKKYTRPVENIYSRREWKITN